MKQAVIENYQSHPKFRFDEVPLQISGNLVQDFARAYGLSRQELSKTNFQTAMRILDKIFLDLRSQTNDELLVEFLDELKSEVSQLMKGDFPFRKKIKSSGDSMGEWSEQLRVSNHFFGSITQSAVKEILAVGADSLNKFRENARNGKLKRTDLSVDSGPVVAKISKIVDREFKNQGIFDEVSRFVGIDYRFTGCSLELSYEGSTWWRDAMGNESPPKTMYAHLDESIFAPKSIVYLSQVTSKNGPTTLFPAAYQEMGNNPLQDIVGRVIGKVGNREGSRLAEHYNKTYHQSAGSPEFRRHFMMLPEEMRFNSHLGWDVMPGSKLENTLVEREVEMLGPAGTFIVFDGSNLLHRGGLIEEGERIVLQVVFYPGTRFGHRVSILSRLIKNLFRGK